MYQGLSSAEIVTQSLAGRGRATPALAPNAFAGAPENWTYRGPQGGGERIRVLMGEFTGYIQYPNGRQHNFANLQGHSGFTNESNEMLDILQIYDKFPGGWVRAM